MKKFWTRLVIYLASMVGISWISSTVLLHFHPLEYYYTPMGMLITAIAGCVKAIIVWPASKYAIQHWLLPSLREGLEGEKKEIIFEELSKEQVVTEFVDD